MNEENDNQQLKQNQEPEKPLCSCITDPFYNLPPELKPRLMDVMRGLRKVTCPACGFTFWTNRKTDLCNDCEKNGTKLPEANAGAGG